MTRACIVQSARESGQEGGGGGKEFGPKKSNIRPNRSAWGGMQYVSMYLFMFVFVSSFDLADACQENQRNVKDENSVKLWKETRDAVSM